MKKLLKFGIAMVATLALSLTAMAAPSPSGTTTISGATDAQGNSVSDLIQSAAFTGSITDADAVSLLGFSANSTVIRTDINAIDIAPEQFPLTITLNVAGVTSTSKVGVLHYTGGAWVKEAATAGNGTVSFTVNDLSPFAIVIEGTTGTATTSPKTGQSSVASIAVLGLATLAAAYVVSRKKVA